MADFKIVSVRLKEDYEEVFKGLTIKSPEDVHQFIKSLGAWKSEEMFLINTDSKGQVISVFNGDSEHIKNNINEMVGRSILVNSASVILLSRGIDATSIEFLKFTRQLSLAYRLCDIPLLDHIYERNEDTYNSYKMQEINLNPIADNDPSLHKFEIWEIKEEPEFSTVKLIDEKSFSANTEKEAVDVVANELKYMDREAFYIISLDESGKPINTTIASMGTINASPVAGREIFKVPLLSGAKQLIFMHNHPSGDMTPSSDDKNVTFKLINAAGVLGMEVKDSMVVAAKTGEIYSMKESNEFEFMAAQGLRNAVRESMQVKEDEGLRNNYLASPFTAELQQVIDGTFNRYSAVKVCDTPEILKAAGLDDYPMFMTQKHVKDILHEKSLNPHHHGLNIEQLSLLPEELKEPVAIYDSLSDDESVVCLTSQVDKDNLPIVVSIRPNGEGIYEMQKMSSNFITSMYGRANFENHFNDVIDSQSLIYINKEKSQDLFRVLQLQLPQGVNNLNFDTIIHKSENAVNARESGYSFTQSKKQIDQVKEDDINKQYESSYKSVKEKTYININKQFVLKDLIDKTSGKSYNLVTIPPNTKAGDIDISGYHFYPLYINQNPFKDSMYTIPYEKERNILLMKGNDKVIVKAKWLKDALAENYKQYSKTKDMENKMAISKAREGLEI